MSRETLIDAIRAELKRQEKEKLLLRFKEDEPDKFFVAGKIDIHKLAEAIRGER